MVGRMIHLLAIAAANPAPVSGGEVAARMAGLRRAAAARAERGGPSADADEVFEFASEAHRRCFDGRSERVIGAASAGLEAVVGVRSSGSEPNLVAVDLVAGTIRVGLGDLSELLRR